jgi:hypothetical protein
MLHEILSSSGLQTNVNQLRQGREGGLLTAQDVVIRKPGVIERRPGLVPITAEGYGWYLGRYNQFLISVGGSLGESLWSGAVEKGAPLTALTTTAPRLMRFAGTSNLFRYITASNNNFYYLTQKGPYKISYSVPLFGADYIPATSAPIPSGVPRALDFTAALDSTVGGWTTPHSTCAYQIVFGRTDANNVTGIGSPSETVQLVNTTAFSYTVKLEFSVPRSLDLSLGYFYQIYRSDQTGSETIPGGVNFQLVAQQQLTAGSLSFGKVTAYDTCPDTNRGAILYSDTSQEGTLQTNDPPPLCRDISEWNGMVFYSNATLNASVTLNLLSVGGTGLIVGDTFSLYANATLFVYYADTTENVTSGAFEVFTGGTSEENRENTAKSLVRVINRDQRTPHPSIHARYLGGNGSLVGQIYLENDNGNYRYSTFLDASFQVGCSRAGVFDPDPYPLDVTAPMSDITNSIYVSKVGKPECVPLTNVFYVGKGGTKILRSFAMMDGLYVLTSDGIYRVTGSTPDTLSVTLLYSDASIGLFYTISSFVAYAGFENAAILDGNIYFLTSQGVLVLNGSGKSNISVPVDDLLADTGYSLAPNATAALLFVNPKTKECAFSLGGNGVLVYNYITQTWVKWSLSLLTSVYSPAITGAVYDPITAKMYYMNNYGILSYEDSAHRFDAAYSRTATSTSGDNILVDSSANVVAGDVLWDGTTSTIATSVPDGTHIKVSPSVSWTAHAFWVCKTYTSKAQYVPISGGMAGPLKRFENLAYHVAGTAPLTLGVSSDLAPTESTLVVTPALSTLTPIRILTPTEQARAHWLMMSVSASAYNATFALHGVSVEYEPISMRGK